MERRDFLRNVAIAGAATALPLPLHARRRASAEQYVALHPFIEAHPDAVFIHRTAVTDKLDSAGKREAGFRLMEELFSASADGGIPVSHAMAIKPNLTCTGGTGDTPAGMGIITDLDFLEGVTAGIADAGFPASRMYVREGNWMGDGYCPAERDVTGPKLEQIAGRVGFHLYDFDSGREVTDLTFDTLREGSEVIWKDIPGGVVLSRIGYLAPCNAEESFLLNIAKFKAHGMGMTLCSKNLQGMTVSPLIRYCEGVENMRRHPAAVQAFFNEQAELHINELYAAHSAAGYRRWDRPGLTADGGYGMETWAQRTCDSLSVTTTGLNIIEGIYGRNGNGFSHGPGPGGTAEDFMTNLVIFGRNSVLVDIIGTWLSGHEPGNFGFFHIAKERGLIDRVDPHSIPVYEWKNGLPLAAGLGDFARTPLVTGYLRQDYNGGSEAEYHLVDEPYDYTTDVASGDAPVPAATLASYPNPVRSQAVIEFGLASSADVRVDVLDAAGRRVAVLAEGRHVAGTHTTVWRPSGLPAGAYWLRMQGSGATRARQIVLIHR